MQRVLQVEFGGLPEALANLYSITGQERYLAVAQRFYHARFLDPLAAGEDRLDGEQCNVNVPKIMSCLRMWEETGEQKYLAIARNFWQIAAGHHSYVIGGQGNYEHWNPPDVVAGALSNHTCEGCVTYNMLKLTRLLHFHDLARMDLLDYYERGLFNQMLGVQDPDSPHGFVCLLHRAVRRRVQAAAAELLSARQPGRLLDRLRQLHLRQRDGLETPAKFADTIYSRDARGVYVNLFIPSRSAAPTRASRCARRQGSPMTR